MINRTDKTGGNFTKVDNNYLIRTDLSLKTIGLLTYLLQLPDDWVIHKSEIQTHFSEGRKAFNNAFKELEENGYINHTQENDKNGEFTHLYEVYEHPNLNDSL